MIVITLDLKELRKKNNWNQIDLAKRLGVHLNTIVNYEKGNPIPESKLELLTKLFHESDERVSNASIATPSYIELPYIPVRARAGFAEMGQVLHDAQQTYRVAVFDPDEPIAKQMVLEIDGDSMEPIYTAGTKVRCKEIDEGDWMYLNSGVYAIVYGNYFVVKRIKNSPRNGMLTLHSDNTETGGTSEVPLSEIRTIWKVMRIVDAPAR